MSARVFISHSSSDSSIANKICSALEADAIRCWIAPRDISPGRRWAECIVEALNNCSVMVVVLSSSSNVSVHVLREVERAIAKAIPVIPFRVEAIKPSEALEYFLSVDHWLDALPPPVEAHLKTLTIAVRSLLEAGLPGGVCAAPSPGDDARFTAGYPEIHPDEWNVRKVSPLRKMFSALFNER